MTDEERNLQGPDRQRTDGRRATDHGRVVRSRGRIIVGLGIVSGVSGVCAIGALVFALVTFRQDETNRTTDLRAACAHGSIRNAADVNQNWIYYQSERELAGDRRSEERFKRTLQSLSPGERKFLLALVKSNPSRRILEVRAQADYAAASVKARSVQLSDIRLIHRSTPLGSEEIPRGWVRSARFSCVQAYS